MRREGEILFVATKDKALQTTTTGALPRPSWYTENLRGAPLSTGFAHRAYREQHFDCLACHTAAQNKAGIDILVDGDTRLDDDVAGRSWVSYAYERIEGFGPPGVAVQPYAAMADKGPGDLIWEVIETRLTPHVTGRVGKTDLQLDRAYKAMAGMTEKPVKIGSISAQVISHMCINDHYADTNELLMDLSDAFNKEYHALADAGAPLLQVEEPSIHQSMQVPGQEVSAEQYVEAFNREVAGLRDKTEVWCHTCWGNPSQQRIFRDVQSYQPTLEWMNQVEADVLTFETCSSGPGDLEAIGSIIEDKKIAIGVIDHHTLQVERPDQIADLIREALKHIPAERLIISSDCGMGREGMSRRHATYKMVAMVQGTNIVREELGLPLAECRAADERFSLTVTEE